MGMPQHEKIGINQPKRVIAQAYHSQENRPPDDVDQKEIQEQSYTRETYEQEKNAFFNNFQASNPKPFDTVKITISQEQRQKAKKDVEIAQVQHQQHLLATRIYSGRFTTQIKNDSLGGLRWLEKVEVTLRRSISGITKSPPKPLRRMYDTEKKLRADLESKQHSLQVIEELSAQERLEKTKAADGENAYRTKIKAALIEWATNGSKNRLVYYVLDQLEQKQLSIEQVRNLIALYIRNLKNKLITDGSLQDRQLLSQILDSEKDEIVKMLKSDGINLSKEKKIFFKKRIPNTVFDSAESAKTPALEEISFSIIFPGINKDLKFTGENNIKLALKSYLRDQFGIIVAEEDLDRYYEKLKIYLEKLEGSKRSGGRGAAKGLKREALTDQSAKRAIKVGKNRILVDHSIEDGGYTIFISGLGDRNEIYTKMGTRKI